MTDRSFTLLEIHLHDGISFSATNNAPAIGRSSGEEGTAEEGSGVLGGRTSSLGDRASGLRDGGAGRAKGVLGGLLVLAVLVGIAAAMRSLSGGDETGESTELEDFVEQ